MLRRLVLVPILAFPGFAQAGDKQPLTPVPQSFDWRGPYVGGQIGGSWSKDTNPRGLPDYLTVKHDGFIGGLYGGYNVQLPNNIVLGLDADFTFGDIHGSSSGYFAVNDSYPTQNQKLKWSGAVRGRVGYAFDRFLPYVAGGLAVARVDVRFDLRDAGTLQDIGTYSGSATATGWTLGGGVEYALSDNIIGRFEYRYSDFGRTDIKLSGQDNEFNLRKHDAFVGISYKF